MKICTYIKYTYMHLKSLVFTTGFRFLFSCVIKAVLVCRLVLENLARNSLKIVLTFQFGYNILLLKMGLSRNT